MQIEIRPTLRLHKVNDGSHAAGRESHAGEVGASDIGAIRLESPGREVLLRHCRGLTDDTLQRRRLRALRQRALPEIAYCHAGTKLSDGTPDRQARVDCVSLRVQSVLRVRLTIGMNSMVLPFNELRATEAAARFLKLWGGPMNYLKLTKLLYLLDREALLRWERPVTTDRCVSVDNGPVVGRIYDLLREKSAPGAGVIWRCHISGLENGEVALLVEPETNSPARRKG